MEIDGLEQEIMQSKILVVDDESMIVDMLVTFLKGRGFNNVVGETNSKNIVHLNQNNEFDLILLDYNMPGMNGLRVLEQLDLIKKEDYLSVVMITGYHEEDLCLKALEAGVRDFIRKPFNQHEILNRIHNILEVRVLYKRERRRNEILDEKFRQRTNELYNTQIEIVRRLGIAGEFRDNDTHMHVVRMSKVCEMLARELGLPEEDSDLFLKASPMHDIGKIGIPDRILMKPASLTYDEWELMKSHVEIGVQILSGHSSNIMNMAKIIAQTHHEKWDGSGYPEGLKEDNIPVAGRIAALSDVFDALLTARPYKRAWTIAEAVDYIHQQSGIHFDPRVVGAFDRQLPLIFEVHHTYKDASHVLSCVE